MIFLFFLITSIIFSYFCFAIMSFDIGPVHPLVPLIIAIAVTCIMYKLNYSEIKKMSNPPKKNPFIEPVEIDEIISTEPFIKIRDAINKIDLELVNSDNLFEYIEKIEAEIGMKLFRKEETSKEKLVELKKYLNAKDLDNMKSITLAELFHVDENDAKEYEKKYMKKPVTSKVESVKDYNEDDELDDDDEFFDDDEDEDEDYDDEDEEIDIEKKRNIEKLRRDVKNLENEYRFERGYDPDWDESEDLSSKYSDEEQRLRARKEELREKNLSYDSYLSPDEREE